MTESPDREGGYEFRHYLGVLWRRKLTIVATMVALTLIGWLLGPGLSDSHTSTAEVLAKPGESVVGAGSSGARADSSVGDEMAIIASDEVRAAVEREAGHPVEVTITPDSPDSNVVLITVTGGADTVQDDAQTYADTYIELRRDELAEGTSAATKQLSAGLVDVDGQLDELGPQIAGLDIQIGATTDELALRGLTNQREDLLAQRDILSVRRAEIQKQLDEVELTAAVNPTLGIEVLSNASEPSIVSGATKVQYASAGLALGLVLGVLLAFGREHFDDSVRTTRDVERAGRGVRVLGVVPRHSQGATR